MSLIEESIFDDELNALENSTDYNNFVIGAINYQNNSQDYQDYIEQKNIIKENAIRNSIINSIKNHFSRRDYNEFKVNDTTFIVYVGDLKTSDVNDLISSLQSKGYICELDNQNLNLTIRSI